jgi:hypothetical protein
MLPPQQMLLPPPQMLPQQMLLLLLLLMLYCMRFSRCRGCLPATHTGYITTASSRQEISAAFPRCARRFNSGDEEQYITARSRCQG